MQSMSKMEAPSRRKFEYSFDSSSEEKSQNSDDSEEPGPEIENFKQEEQPTVNPENLRTVREESSEEESQGEFYDYELSQKK